MKRHLIIVDGEYKSYRVNPPFYQTCLRLATPAEQAAYEFGRQEKAEEILEALTREFFRKEKS